MIKDKSTLDNPRVFEIKIFPEYFILSVESHPEIQKYKQPLGQ